MYPNFPSKVRKIIGKSVEKSDVLTFAELFCFQTQEN
jgi:hypothetical protein